MFFPRDPALALAGGTISLSSVASQNVTVNSSLCYDAAEASLPVSGILAASKAIIFLVGSLNQGIAGISPTAGFSQQLWVQNVGVNQLIILHNSASATLGLRIMTPTAANLFLPVNAWAMFQYRPAESRWRVML